MGQVYTLDSQSCLSVQTDKQTSLGWAQVKEKDCPYEYENNSTYRLALSKLFLFPQQAC